MSCLSQGVHRKAYAAAEEDIISIVYGGVLRVFSHLKLVVSAAEPSPYDPEL